MIHTSILLYVGILVVLYSDDIDATKSKVISAGGTIVKDIFNFPMRKYYIDEKDETCLSHGELYTIVTNKAAKGKKGSIAAIVAGTKADKVIEVLCKIPLNKRNRVFEVTLDMSGSMELIVRRRR